MGHMANRPGKRRAVDLDPLGRVWRQRLGPSEIPDQPDQHAEPGDREPGVPAEILGDGPGEQGGDESAEVDHHRIDLEGVGKAAVPGGIERADLAFQIAAQQPGADHQQAQRKQERAIEGEREVPRGHGQGADGDSHAALDELVAQPAAHQRQTGEHRVIEAEGLGGDGRRGNRAEHGLKEMAIGGKAGDVFHPPGLEQVAGHIEDQHGGHAVKTDPVPQLGAVQGPQAAGVAPHLRSVAGGQDDGRGNGGAVGFQFHWRECAGWRGLAQVGDRA